MDLTRYVISGRGTGPNVLVTAGMDGDEYTGIATAYRLKNHFRNIQCAGSLTVLPLINRAGFQNTTAFSPADGKYPKLVFPGNKNGTDTERLMSDLYETYVRGSDLWIDLHGGSLTEDMKPFVWMYQSSRLPVRGFQQQFIKNIPAPTVVWDRNPFMAYSRFLEKQGLNYLLFECGGLGTSHESDITQMTRWVEHALRIADFLPGEAVGTVPAPRIFTAVRYELSPMDGFWQTGVESDKFLGQLLSPDMGKRRVIKRQKDFILWQKTGGFVRRGDILGAYAK